MIDAILAAPLARGLAWRLPLLRFGDRFAFWGAIDQQHLLSHGTDEELEADIKEKMEILGAGGGYMISPAHIIQSDVSPERVESFIALCRKHGAY